MIKHKLTLMWSNTFQLVQFIQRLHLRYSTSRTALSATLSTHTLLQVRRLNHLLFTRNFVCDVVQKVLSILIKLAGGGNTQRQCPGNAEFTFVGFSETAGFTQTAGFYFLLVILGLCLYLFRYFLSWSFWHFPPLLLSQKTHNKGSWLLHAGKKDQILTVSFYYC